MSEGIVEPETKASVDSAAEEATGERQAERGKDAVTGYVQEAADDFRRAEGDVEKEWIAFLLRQGVRGFDGLAETIRDKSVLEMATDTRRFAKDHPGLFAAGCFAAGLALNRTLRATKHQSSYTGDDGRLTTSLKDIVRGDG